MPQLFKDSTVIKVSKQPAWCSDVLWESILERAGAGRGLVKAKFSRAERKILRKRKAIKVSKWAERHRVLTMSALPGIWRNKVTPYLVGVMDAAAMPFVHEITLCATPQTGKTESAHNLWGIALTGHRGR